MQRATVAVVDPDPKVRTAIKAALRAEGYRVLGVSSGLAALVLCACHEVDVVVAELELGAFSGEALAGALSARFPGLVILGISAHPPVQPPASMARVLSKPLDAQTLLASLRHVLEDVPKKQPGVEARGARSRRAQAGNG